MTQELIKFIQKNKDLINENSKESWEEIYNKLVNNFILKGEFTEIILSAGIDPAKILGYIPNYYLCRSNVTNYKIPNSITSIGNSAFSNCYNLTSMIIPDSITSIGAYTFYNCISLTSIEIPNSVESIGSGAFYKCSSLTSVVIPDSVTSIGDYAFRDCNNLKEIAFKGTKEQAIQLGIGNRARKKWREGSSIEKIICNDGEIIL